ncbi:CARDB domain-containing protein [Thermodesulfatator atlanticus]|uniref:CARDB domain-containing protein n=1 Tax=Thermodesulfatator atlanticus TaxID=501497 RepID=UPI0003B49BEC|nr:CARDB domain-containing protein [Thermodesulfatator atlanticus]
MKHAKRFFLFLLILFLASSAFAASPFWTKQIRLNVYPYSMSLEGINTASEKVLATGRISYNGTYYFGAFLLDRDGNLLDSKIFRPVIGDEEKNVGLYPKGLLLDNGEILLAGKYYAESVGAGLPFFARLGNETPSLLYLKDPTIDDSFIKLTYNLVIPAENFVPAGEYVYFVGPATVNLGCGVHGFYIAKVKKDLSEVAWHKFLALAYERKTCYGQNCESATITFPATCLLSQHSLELRDAVADGQGNLILVGKILIAYATQINATSPAGFVWSISPSGETNWFKVYARTDESDEKHPLLFDKAAIYKNGDQEILIIAGQTGIPGASTLWLGAIDPQDGSIINHKIGHYPENPRSTRADLVQGMSLYQGKIYLHFYGYIGEDSLRSSLLVIDPQNLEQEKLYKSVNVPSKDMLPWYNSDSTAIFIGFNESSYPYLYTFGSNGHYCRGQGDLSEGPYLTADFDLSVIDWSALPVPQGSQTVTYTLKIYDVTAGSYEEGSISFASDISPRIDTVCGEVSLNVSLDPQTVEGCYVLDDKDEISCPGDCMGYYGKNWPVTLQASCNEDSDYVFSYWSGACTDSGSTCNLTMDEDKEVTAHFECREIGAPQSVVAYPSDLHEGETFTLSWDSVEDAASYEIYKCSYPSANPAEDCTKVATTTETSITLTASLPAEADYYTWYYIVSAKRSCGSEAYSDPVSISVSMNQPPEIESFSVEPISGVAPLTVTFTCEASDPDGAIAAYELNPGDGSEPLNSELGTFSYTYENPGTYNATCTAYDNADASVTSEPITVEVSPAAETAADLVVTKLVTPRFWRAGKRGHISVLIENQGEVDVTKPFVVRVYANPMAPVYVIGEQTINGLKAGERKLVRFRFRVPAELCTPSNQHTLYVTVDADNQISETDEENNTLEKAIIVRGCRR